LKQAIQIGQHHFELYMSPLPLGGEVAVSAAGEGCLISYSNGGSILEQKPSPGPERPTSPASGRGDIFDEMALSTKSLDHYSK